MRKNFWLKLKKPILALAPMAGVTDSAFRLICKKHGADVVYTEMISADGLYYNSKKTLELLKFDKKEKPIVCQLFGKRPECFTQAVKTVEKAGFNGIDINFGCPARKVVAHGGGVTLMRDLDKCFQIIKTVCEYTNLPVSVKIRTGIRRTEGAIHESRLQKTVTALDFIKKIKGLPVTTIMIHGRTYEQGFSGPIDTDIIKQAKKRFSGLILANGGINTPEDAKDVLEKTGADGIALARGLYGGPWLFKQIKQYLKTGSYFHSDKKFLQQQIILHAKLVQKQKGHHGLIELRKHLAWYVKGLPGAAKLRSQLVRFENITDIKKVLAEL